MTFDLRMLAGLHDDDHVKTVGGEWRTVRELRGELHTGIHQDTADAEPEYAPVNGYEPHLAKLRAAASTRESKFEEQWKASRAAEFEATRRALAEEEPQPRLTAAGLGEFAAPDPYRTALDKMKERQ